MDFWTNSATKDPIKKQARTWAMVPSFKILYSKRPEQIKL